MNNIKILFDMGIEISSFPIEVGYNYQFVCFDKLNEEQEKKVEVFRKNIKLLTCDKLFELIGMFGNHFGLEKHKYDSGVWYILNLLYQLIDYLKSTCE